MLTPDELDELKVIFEKLAGRTPTDEEIEALKACSKGNQPITFQVAKYINNVNQAQDSQFGDRLSQNADAKATQPAKLKLNQPSVDELVQQVRLRCHDDIQRLHGTMPLLGVDHWVDLGELFVDVNILEELSSSRKSELDDLWQDFIASVQEYSSDRSLDRIGLGKQQKRMPGLTVLAKNTDLMVLGKPGSGKTTFLQRIVTECNKGKLQPHRIPVFIKMREFVDDGRNFEYSLERYLTQQWRLSEVETELVLSQGRGLILLDGLDEVTGVNGRQISKQIKRFARIYPQNQLVITCRTQSQESRFERFYYVEVADFNEAQVNAFAKHWYKVACSNTEERKAKARQFLDKLYLEENKTIRELAITPILLSLTCAVFQAQGKFYSKRSKLYEEGLELLLEKWDKSREIERDEIYRDLSMERKQELLSYLALKKFEQPQYVLFEQEEIEGYIAEFLEISRRDSRVVLRAIEAQHGLLIERAQKVWSFSHLTFQEYFVAKWFCDRADWASLVKYITCQHWREVFLIGLTLAETEANRLLLRMKQAVNSLIAPDQKIQYFLNWVNQKSLSVQVPDWHHAAAIRALYLDMARFINRATNLNIDTSIVNVFLLSFAIDPKLGTELVLGIEIGRTRHFYTNIELIYDIDFTQTITNAYKLGDDSGLCVDFLIHYLDDAMNLNSEIGEALQTLQQQIKEQRHQAKGENCTKKLQDLMVKNRNISHDWQFSNEQKKLLQQYYDANKLLVDCLKSGCVVSNEVRQDIEETLLLPIAEIEKRKCQR